jgi:hypothetical protein
MIAVSTTKPSSAGKVAIRKTKPGPMLGFVKSHQKAKNLHRLKSHGIACDG